MVLGSSDRVAAEHARLPAPLSIALGLNAIDGLETSLEGNWRRVWVRGDHGGPWQFDVVRTNSFVPPQVCEDSGRLHLKDSAGSRG